MVICALKIGGKRSFGSAAVYAPKLNLTLKVPKTLINQCFLTKNKNYNFGTYRIKIIVLIWSKWRDSFAFSFGAQKKIKVATSVCTGGSNMPPAYCILVFESRSIKQKSPVSAQADSGLLKIKYILDTMCFRCVTVSKPFHTTTLNFFVEILENLRFPVKYGII